MSRMKQVVLERPFSQNQHFREAQMLCNGPLDHDSDHYQPNASRSWYQTSWNINTMPGSISSDNTATDESSRAICRDYYQGSCTRGMSCKFRHPGFGELVGSRLCRNEQQKLGVAEHPRKFMYFGEIKDGDSRRSFTKERRSRSPCRKFQMGKCEHGVTCYYVHHEFTKYHEENKDGDLVRYRSTSPCCGFQRCTYDSGANYPYLLDEFINHDRPVTDWNAKQHHGLGAASRNLYLDEGHLDNILMKYPGKDSMDGENGSRTMSFLRETRSRSPCRNFRRGRCRFGASCRNEHDHSSQQQPGISAAISKPMSYWNAKQDHGSGPTSGNTDFHEENVDGILKTYHGRDGGNKENDLRIMSFSREHRSRSPCHYFLRGRCCYGASCRNEHDQNAQEHHKVVMTSVSLPSDKDNGFNAGDDKLRLEVCLKFTKGRCARGESCKYLHSFHEYANSISQRNEELRLEAVADLMNVDVTSQSTATMAAQEHDAVKNDAKQSSELKETDNSRVSSDGSFNQETNGLSRKELTAEYANHMTNEQHPRAANHMTNKQHSGVATTSISLSSREDTDPETVGDKRRLEFCLKFAKGRCARGESCKYLHSFHEYATSIFVRSEELRVEAVADLMNVGVTSQSSASVTAEEDDAVKNDRMQSKEFQHTAKGVVSAGESFHQETNGISTKELGADDENGTSNEKYPRDTNHMTNEQYPGAAETSVSLLSREDNISHVMAPQRHDMKLEKCFSGGPNTSTGVLSKNNKDESAANASVKTHLKLEEVQRPLFTEYEADDLEIDMAGGQSLGKVDVLVPKSTEVELKDTNIISNKALPKRTIDGVIELTCLERESPDSTKGKPCEICGDIGYMELIVICCKCDITREHRYCMTILPEDKDIWACENCEPANRISSSKLDSETPAPVLQEIPNSNEENFSVKSGCASVQTVGTLPGEGLGHDAHANAQPKNHNPEGNCCISRAHSFQKRESAQH